MFFFIRSYKAQINFFVCAHRDRLCTNLPNPFFQDYQSATSTNTSCFYYAFPIED